MASQQLLLGAGGVSEKSYIDDAFSTYLYEGNSSSNQVTNGINNTEKSLVWLKNRTIGGSGRSPMWLDTVRGGTKYLLSDSNGGQGTDNGYHINTFNNNGFTLQNNGNGSNSDGDQYVSWNFKAQKGFFDIVNWSGDGSGDRVISHGLGCMPGMIILKSLSTSGEWYTYHRGIGEDKYVQINSTTSQLNFSGAWTGITSTQFPLKAGFSMNASGHTYIAYLFAGGESTAATARSVDFDGDDSLELSGSSDFELNGDFTVEGWFNPDSTSTTANVDTLWDIGNYTNAYGVILYLYNGDLILEHSANVKTSLTGGLPLAQWSHVALVRSSSTISLYINGTLKKSYTDSQTYGTSGTNEFYVGTAYNNSGLVHGFDGKISNVRVVKGTAVYTSSFRPPTTPLTNITNTKLLCCNDSSTTGKTVGGTITANGNPTASTDSPFDDPAGFKFGESGDQNIIKCGTYKGNGANAGPKVELGWEPQWIMWKRYSGNDSWYISDCMRGIYTGAADMFLAANENANEAGGTAEGVQLLSTGFELTASGNWVNANGDDYIYIAIRRPDGYVGKPVEDATKVFAMDYGNSGTDVPAFDSGFPVDMRIGKGPTMNDHWYVGTRSMYQKHVRTDDNGGEIAGSWSKFDYSAGDGKNWTSSYLGYMWKRHAGFDVVNFYGNQTAKHTIPHSLNAVPEMMWFKSRGNAANDWAVYHKGLDSVFGEPETHYMLLNANDGQADGEMFSDTAPTSTHFTVGNFGESNDDGEDMLAFLFSSVPGVSKVGSYTGNYTTGHTITTGFQPRFLLLKSASQSHAWYVVDTTRGWGASDDKIFILHSSAAQAQWGFGQPESNGFSLNADGAINGNGEKYIYYAHA